jgi:hypothetical protein
VSVDPNDLLRQDAAIEEEVARQTRFLRSENARLSDEAEELRRLVNFYDSARHTRLVVPTWRRPGRRIKSHVGTQMVQMTDWHLDEVVDPREILDLNKYDRRIAHMRVTSWAEKAITLPRKYMAGLELEGMIIPATGDLFSGEIHDELTATNEDTILASMLYWMEHIIGLIEMMAAETPGIEIDCVPGNHPRTTKKFDHKQRVKKNYEQFFWSVVRDRLADRGKAKNVVVNVSQGTSMNISVYGRNYVLDHGYGFKGGTGISGAFSPLSLGSHRKNLKQVVAGTPMHTMIIGHMHQIINIPGVIMGGTLKGYDEYAFDLNLRPDENGAGQAFWVTSPERAQVMWMPIYVQDRETEGW